MTAEAFDKLVREIDEQMVIRTILEKCKHVEVISETAILMRNGVGRYAITPRRLRLKIKRLLKSLSESGVLIKRRELHSAAGKMEVGYDLSPVSLRARLPRR